MQQACRSQSKSVRDGTHNLANTFDLEASNGFKIALIQCPSSSSNRLDEEQLFTKSPRFSSIQTSICQTEMEWSSYLRDEHRLSRNEYKIFSPFQISSLNNHCQISRRRKWYNRRMLKSKSLMPGPNITLWDLSRTRTAGKIWKIGWRWWCPVVHTEIRILAKNIIITNLNPRTNTQSTKKQIRKLCQTPSHQPSASLSQHCYQIWTRPLDKFEPSEMWVMSSARWEKWYKYPSHSSHSSCTESVFAYDTDSTVGTLSPANLVVKPPISRQAHTYNT